MQLAVKEKIHNDNIVEILQAIFNHIYNNNDKK